MSVDHESIASHFERELIEARAENARLRRELAGSFTYDQYHAGCDALRNERNRAQDEVERLQAVIRCERASGKCVMVHDP